MSKRMLHENITTSEKFSKVGFEAECLYNRLLTQTDDYGNVRGSIGYIKDVCFPRKKKTKNIDYQMVGKWLAECLQVGLLIKYVVDDIEYLHFNRFDDFQQLRKDRLKKSSIPYYDCLRSNGCQVANQMVADCPHELEVKEEIKEEVKEEVNKGKPKNIEEVSTYCKERNSSIDAEQFFNHYETNGWYRGKNKIRDWKACLRTWEINNKASTASARTEPMTLAEMKADAWRIADAK